MLLNSGYCPGEWGHADKLNALQLACCDPCRSGADSLQFFPLHYKEIDSSHGTSQRRLFEIHCQVLLTVQLLNYISYRLHCKKHLFWCFSLAGTD